MPGTPRLLQAAAALAILSATLQYPKILAMVLRRRENRD